MNVRQLKAIAIVIRTDTALFTSFISLSSLYACGLLRHQRIPVATPQYTKLSQNGFFTIPRAQTIIQFIWS